MGEFIFGEHYDEAGDPLIAFMLLGLRSKAIDFVKSFHVLPEISWKRHRR
jgi:hypothetical protein